MTEAELLTAVTELISEVSHDPAHGPSGLPRLLWHHCGDSRRCGGDPGFPDLIITGARGTIAAELKSDDGEPTAEQQFWSWMIYQSRPTFGPPVMIAPLWQPADLKSGRIRAELESIA